MESNKHNKYILMKKYLNDKIIFLLALISLFIEFPLEHIMLYQEVFHGFGELPRKLFRLTLQIPISTILFTVLIKDLFNKNSSNSFKIISILVSVIIISVVVVVLLNWSRDDLSDFNKSNIKISAFYLYYFTIGYSIASGFRYLEKYKWILIGGLILMSAQALIFININTVSIDFVNASRKSDTHLFMGYSYVIWSIITLMAIRKEERAFVYIITVAITFLFSSRGSFYCYLIIFPAFIIKAINKKIMLGILTGSILLILILFLSYDLQSHRMISVLYGNDLSFQFRIETFKNNMPDLFNNWLLGDYAGFLKHDEPANTYMHNILSYWRQFGLLTFISVVSLFIFCGREAFRTQTTVNGLKEILILLLLFNAPALLFIKAYTYAALFLMFGICAAITNLSHSEDYGD